MQTRTLIVRGLPGSLMLEFANPCGSLKIDNVPEVVHKIDGRRVTLNIAKLQEDRVSIPIQYSGEFLELERPAIRAASSAELPEALARPEEDDGEANIWTWRDRRARDSKDWPRAKLFFNLLDYQAPFSDARVYGLTRRCKIRLKSRIDGTPPEYEPTELGRRNVRHFSGMILAGLRTFFPLPGELGFDLQEVEVAFDRFAAGELWMVDGTAPATPARQQACMPNSAFYLLLPEFGEMCVHAEVDREEWKALMPALVHTCEVFCKSFVGAPRSADGRLSAYGPVVRREWKEPRPRGNVQADLVAFRNASGPYGEAPFAAKWRSILTTHMDLTGSPAPLEV